MSRRTIGPVLLIVACLIALIAVWTVPAETLAPPWSPEAHARALFEDRVACDFHFFRIDRFNGRQVILRYTPEGMVAAGGRGGAMFLAADLMDAWKAARREAGLEPEGSVFLETPTGAPVMGWTPSEAHPERQIPPPSRFAPQAPPRRDPLR